MTHNPKVIEAVAMIVDPDEDWQSALTIATALLDTITPLIVADEVKAEREAIVESLKGKMAIAPLGYSASSRAAWIDGAKAASAIFMAAVRARGNTE